MITFKQFVNEQKQSIKVFYHLDMDGYGAAYAVWKVLGDSAKYIKDELVLILSQQGRTAVKVRSKSNPKYVSHITKIFKKAFTDYFKSL